MGDMRDKLVLVTGGTGGIGQQTALGLARLGAHVIITGRDAGRGAAAVRAIQQASSGARVDLLLADLAEQRDVRALAAQVQQNYPRLDGLINNAGVFNMQRKLTTDGLEATFAVNVLAPFLLTHLLLPALQAAPSARVINVTGGSPGNLALDNLQGERKFTGFGMYSQSKTAMMALAYEFAQRWQGSTVTVNVCYPGRATTPMTRNFLPQSSSPLLRGLLNLLQNVFFRDDGGQSAAKAARSSIYLASAPEVAGVSGTYFGTNSERLAWKPAMIEATNRQALWALSSQLTHLEGGALPG